MGRHLTARKGLASSLVGLVIGMVLLGAIIYWQKQIDTSVLGILTDLGVIDPGGVDELGNSSLYPAYFYLIGNLVIIVYLFFNRADLRAGSRR